jgi:flagellar biosynthesis regulator FlbT
MHASSRNSLDRLEADNVSVDAFRMRLEELEKQYEHGEDVTAELDELKKHVEDRELYEGLKDMQDQA